MVMDIINETIAKRSKPNIEIIKGMLINAANAGIAPPAKLHNECLFSINIYNQHLKNIKDNGNPKNHSIFDCSSIVADKF